ncbi:hypothetical protein [Shewanella sp. MBTL60-007]|uniref:hypothetical protein n=1 Tax=Shewanella sp. MBTL60-007 TaxID=2815911 RepID=UPI001BB85D29|nr:hypothetical protein [Shewanella sp. MBTL60-007]GIU20996.1 hypothetical protein TUM3792_21340 [Shewanella sp. MBTL60-007]
MARIPDNRKIYTFPLNKQKFTLFLDSYWGLILRTETSINAEILHSQIWHTDENKHLGLTATGWHLTRWGNEAVEELNGLTDNERLLLSTEFGLPICTHYLELPYRNNDSFLTSPSANKLRDWIKMHPIISKRLSSRSEKILYIFKILGVPAI